MRALRSAALLLGLITLPSAAPVSRGTEHFTLGMTRTELGAVLAERGLAPISDVHGVLAVESDQDDAVYERFAFVRSPRDGQLVLWQVTTGYGFPADVAVFHRLAGELGGLLGGPTRTSGALDADRKPVGLHERLWVAGSITVQLAARWTDEPDPDTDRMLVTWTDQRLARLARAQAARDPKAASRR